MKIFQIFGGFCHWDATRKHPTLESTIGYYAPNIVFVEAPDTVWEGWGYDDTQEGDARFIQPSLPEPSQWTTESGELRQWMYDTSTGTFYLADGDGKPIPTEDLAATIDNMQAALAEMGVNPEGT